MKHLFENHPEVGIAVVLVAALAAMWLTGRIIG